MERAERMVLLGVGLAYAPLLVPLLWVMLVLTAATAVFRFFRVWRQAEPPPLRPGSIGYKRAQAEAAEDAGPERPAHERATLRRARPARRGVATAAPAERARPPRSPRRRLLRARGGRFVTAAYRTGARVAAHVPPGPAGALGSALGRLAALASAERDGWWPATRSAPAAVHRRGGRSPTPSPATGATGSTPSSSRRIDRADLDARFRADGMEHLAAATAGGRGAIFALPHLGAWEVAGRWVAARATASRSSSSRSSRPSSSPGSSTSAAPWASRSCRSAPRCRPAPGTRLADGRVLCLVADRDLGGTGVEVEFFGERTRLPAGPALMALRHDVEILPVGTYTEPHGRHHSVIHPPVDRARHGRLGEDVTRITQSLAHVFEDIIRQAPEQWHLQQPNWPSDLVRPTARAGSRRSAGMPGRSPTGRAGARRRNTAFRPPTASDWHDGIDAGRGLLALLAGPPGRRAGPGARLGAGAARPRHRRAGLRAV